MPGPRQAFLEKEFKMEDPAREKCLSPVTACLTSEGCDKLDIGGWQIVRLKWPHGLKTKEFRRRQGFLGRKKF